jgi:hypothetical protein
MTCFETNIRLVSLDGACTLCDVPTPSNLIVPYPSGDLCQHCFDVLQDDRKIEEEVTQPWTIDESLSDEAWEAELLRRRIAYRQGLALL